MWHERNITDDAWKYSVARNAHSWWFMVGICSLWKIDCSFQNYRKQSIGEKKTELDCSRVLFISHFRRKHLFRLKNTACDHGKIIIVCGTYFVVKISIYWSRNIHGFMAWLGENLAGIVDYSRSLVDELEIYSFDSTLCHDHDHKKHDILQFMI